MAMTLFLRPAYAGNLNGTIEWSKKDSASDKQNGGREVAIVWIEGAEESRSPLAPQKLSEKDQKFTPDFLVLAKGQELDVTNDDEVAHVVYSTTVANPLNLGRREKGETQSVTFSQTGIFDLSCSMHRSMHAQIFVVPTRYFAVSHAGGSFTIPNVPAGSYTLKVWDERARMFAQSVTVPRFGAANISVVLESPQLSAQTQ